MPPLATGLAKTKSRPSSGRNDSAVRSCRFCLARFHPGRYWHAPATPARAAVRQLIWSRDLRVTIILFSAILPPSANFVPTAQDSKLLENTQWETHGKTYI